jgi:hypothetical protein
VGAAVTYETADKNDQFRHIRELCGTLASDQQKQNGGVPMAAIGDPLRTHEIPDPQEVPHVLPQTEPVAVPEPAGVPG